MPATFLYGLGAAKAGTTWLSRAMRGHDECALPPVKETHYFDSLERGGSIWALDQYARVRAQKRDELRAATDGETRRRIENQVRELDRWMALIGAQRMDDPTYEWLMRRRVRAGTQVVADITPAYALLSEAALARMLALNESHTRFLMILRDPVDRLWSNISMTAERRIAKGADPHATRTQLIEAATQAKSDEHARSDYATALARLEAVVPEAQRLVVFFEELFANETMSRISTFLGLSTPITGPDEKINAGTQVDLPAAERTLLARHLRTQYEDILARFGEVPARWQTNMQEIMA